MKRIGFIGLGHMGNPMVQRLVEAGFSVKVYDISKQAVAAVTALGATATEDVTEVVTDVDVIFTMLRSGDQVKSICFGKQGLFANAAPEVLYIDCSSIELDTTKALHYEALTFGVHMLDAPVSGGVGAAKAGTLTFMVGGNEKNLQRALPVLEKMGKTIVHAGPSGHGQAAKICNNLILGISMLAVCEGFTLAEKLQLDLKKFFEISANSSSQCWSITHYCPVPGLMENVPANNDYKAGFTAGMMLKDLRLGQHAAENVNAVVPLGSMAMEMYSLFVNQGNKDTDFSGIINMLRQHS
jgi:3-hydroxyisobutyrate dehydrogenase